MYRYPARATINGQALDAHAVLAPCRVVFEVGLHGPKLCELWSPEALAELGIKRVEAEVLSVDGTGWPYLAGQLCDVLLFGYALCLARAGKWVESTVQGQYLELNRMRLDDSAPRNSESRAFSQAIKYIRRAMPTVAWIQSFADERCGRWGVVYQAANFLYCGHHKTRFYELDGETYHGMLLTAHPIKTSRGWHLRQNIHRALRRSLRQFRYVFFLKRDWMSRLRLPARPY